MKKKEIGTREKRNKAGWKEKNVWDEDIRNNDEKPYNKYKDKNNHKNKQTQNKRKLRNNNTNNKTSVNVSSLLRRCR
jgi:hypothetical protein